MSPSLAAQVKAACGVHSGALAFAPPAAIPTPLLVLSGYSLYGAVTLFEKLAKLQKEICNSPQSSEEEPSELPIQSLKGYFRSHPQPAERLAQANILIAQENWQPP